MRIARADTSWAKGWHLGPWNSDLTVSVGYANEDVDDPHSHRRMAELYLVGRGTAVLRVGEASVTLQPGDVLVVEPGEAHTFLSSSPDFFHFVVQTSGLQGDEARADKTPVGRSVLGL